MLNRFRSADYDRLLELLNAKTIHLLGRYNRDQAARMLCRILVAQPRFLTFAGCMSGAIWQKFVRQGYDERREILTES